MRERANAGQRSAGPAAHRHGRPRHGVVRRLGGAHLRPRRVSAAAGCGGDGGDLAGEAPKMTRAPALRAPPRGSAPFLAFELALLSVGLLLSEGPVRNAAAQQRPERETQEEVAPCRVVTGQVGLLAGRTTMGGCARAIQAGSGAGTGGGTSSRSTATAECTSTGSMSGRCGRPTSPQKIRSGVEGAASALATTTAVAAEHASRHCARRWGGRPITPARRRRGQSCDGNRLLQDDLAQIPGLAAGLLRRRRQVGEEPPVIGLVKERPLPLALAALAFRGRGAGAAAWGCHSSRRRLSLC